MLGGVYAVYPALSGRPISWILLLIAAFVFMAASGETVAVEGRARFDAGHRPDGP